MATIKYRELRRRYELDGADKTVAHLSEALGEKHLAPEDFSIRELAEALVTTRGGDSIGHEWVREYCDPRGGRLLMEAGEGVDTTAFSNITGQVIYSQILAAYQHPEFVLSDLVQTVPTRLSGEKIPGIGRMGDEAAQVDEGMPYESVGFGEEFIETPPTAKRGFIVPVTKEAVFFDRTNLILSRAAEVGEFLGLNKEKRIVDVVIGATNNYKRNGTSLNTYLTSGSWINSLASNELLDWTDIDNAEQLWADMTDPNTGEPILVSGKSLIVMPAKRHTTNRILNATEVSETTGTTTLTASDNPVGGGQYTARASVIAYKRIQSELSETPADAKKWWFLGEFRKAFAYMENWPVTVTQAPQNSEAEFNQDIVIRFKASERGAVAVLDPRFVIKSTG